MLPLCKKEMNLRIFMYLLICAKKKKFRKDKPETNERDYPQGWGRVREWRIGYGRRGMRGK